VFFHLGRGPEYPVLSDNRMLYKMLGHEAENSLVGISAGIIITHPVHWQQIEDDLINDGTSAGVNCSSDRKGEPEF
jgi:hypothetical protein